MISKDPKDVVHEVDALEAYMDAYLRDEGITFEQWVPRFAGSFYQERNGIMLDLLRHANPRRVLEFACAGPYLAETVLAAMPGIRSYECTNFSDRMVAYCRDHLRSDPRASAAVRDADVRRAGDMRREELAAFDTILTTSLEHIQFDRELVAEFAPGTVLVCSVARFDDPEHFRVFDSVDDVVARYDGILRVMAARTTADGNKLVISAVRGSDRA